MLAKIINFFLSLSLSHPPPPPPLLSLSPLSSPSLSIPPFYSGVPKGTIPPNWLLVYYQVSLHILLMTIHLSFLVCHKTLSGSWLGLWCVMPNSYQYKHNVITWYCETKPKHVGCLSIHSWTAYYMQYKDLRHPRIYLAKFNTERLATSGSTIMDGMHGIPAVA